ncbi:hypothetical protein MXF13_04625 [Leclercia adecarboxylata]|uniref:hypothetical protein n=1 Tax=Leclercia TaxID=83654 RepID=UPI001BDBC4A4|nr:MULTISPECIES: hypothetical protein [Leclercia]MEB5749174.1 hypothetical protein [Leclercia adecarboxylata]QVV59449.1 hypothetical protein JV208_06615 [Leclercia sp. Colony189]
MQHTTNLTSDNNLHAALCQLNGENRLITTPWSRIVRGLGLGQYPMPYSETLSLWIQEAFEDLKHKTQYKNSYVRFSSLLCDFICLLIKPKERLSDNDKFDYISNILYLINSEPDPYRKVMQYSITIDALAKLNINLFDILEKSVDLPRLLFTAINEIKSNRIKDENSGKHGDYEKLSAYTSVFFALAVCNKAQAAVTWQRNHISEALQTLATIPSPFFRGRGGSMLFSAISLMGYRGMLQNDGRDYIFETLDYLDNAATMGIDPTFPQSMTPAFVTVYPLLTMLNAIAAAGHHQAIHYKQDRISQANALMDSLTPVERTHMGLYYIMAIFNLGLLDREEKRVNALIEELVHTAHHIDPSENYFLHGIASSYVIETATLTGRKSWLTEQIINNLAGSFARMNRKLEDEINRPYPLAYALTMLAEAGHADKLFEPSACYENRSAISWTIDNLTQIEDGADGRLYMLNHALINLMLRMRGNGFTMPRVYSDFIF